MDLEDETAVPGTYIELETDLPEDELALDLDEDQEDFLDDESPEEEAMEFAPVHRQSSQRSKISLEELVACFAPCGRCGYFLTGYRAAVGLANLQTAVDHARSGWIALTWNDAVRELVLKSYASDIEENDFHFEGSCPECRRHFIYRAPHRPNSPHTFRIEVKLRRR